MNVSHTLDEFDVKILQRLQEDGSQSSKQLAKAVGLRPTPCWRRLQALQKEKVLLGYHARIDPEKVGLGVTVLVSVTLDKKTAAVVKEFEKKVGDRPEVLECYEMSGRADYILKVMAASIHEYRQFLVEWLLQVDGVSATESNFVLQVVKADSVLPLKVPSTFSS